MHPKTKIGLAIAAALAAVAGAVGIAVAAGGDNDGDDGANGAAPLHGYVTTVHTASPESVAIH